MTMLVKNIPPAFSRNTFIVIFVAVILLSFKIAASFLIAVGLGAIIAHALQPMQNRFAKKYRPKYAAYLTFIGFIIIVVLPMGIFVSSLIKQATQLKKYISFHELISIKSITETVGKWPMINYLFEDADKLQEQINTWATEFGTNISEMALNQAAQIPALLIQTIIMLISCLVFLMEGEKFALWFSAKIPIKDSIKNSIIESFSNSSKRAAWASLAASGTQAFTIFLGYLVLNIPAAVLAGGATFIFAFIPFLGAMPVWIAGTIYLYLKGFYVKMAFMIGIGIVAGLVDNVARAWVLKGPYGLHPLVGLISVFGGIQVFGFFGVLIGPIVVALLITLCEVWPQVWND